MSKRILPTGSTVTFTQWQSKATENWHVGEPKDITRARRIQVQYDTPRGKTGYFTVNAPFPGRGSTEDRLDRLADLLQGNIDYYVDK